MGSSDSFRFNLTIPLFMDVFFVAVFLFLSGCHILIEKSAIFITKMQFLSLEDITLQFLKNRKEKKLLKTTKMLHYLFTYFVSQHRTNFFRLVLISVSPQNLLFIETEIRMIHAKKSFLLKKVDFPLLQFPSQRKKKKSREIKRVLNDFVVTYQKKHPSH